MEAKKRNQKEWAKDKKLRGNYVSDEKDNGKKKDKENDTER